MTSLLRTIISGVYTGHVRTLLAASAVVAASPVTLCARARDR